MVAALPTDYNVGGFHDRARHCQFIAQIELSEIITERIVGGAARLAYYRQLVYLRTDVSSRVPAVYFHVYGPTWFRPHHIRAICISFVKFQPAQSGASDATLRSDSYSGILGRERLPQQTCRVQRRHAAERARPKRHRQGVREEAGGAGPRALQLAVCKHTWAHLYSEGKDLDRHLLFARIQLVPTQDGAQVSYTL